MVRTGKRPRAGAVDQDLENGAGEGIRGVHHGAAGGIPPSTLPRRTGPVVGIVPHLARAPRQHAASGREGVLQLHQELLDLPGAEVGPGQVDRPLATELRLGAGEKLMGQRGALPDLLGQRGNAR